MRFLSTIDLLNLLEQEKAVRKGGQWPHRRISADLVDLHELGHLPFSQPGGALLLYLRSILYNRTCLFFTTNLGFSEWATELRAPKRTTALRYRLMQHCWFVETGNERYRFKHG